MFMHSLSRRDRRFAFIVHYVEDWNWLLPFFKFLNDNPYLAVLTIPLWPLCSFMAFVFLIGRKAWMLIDEFEFYGISGDTIAIRNFAKHFRAKHKDLIRNRILSAVLAAQDRGATVIGLGALVKAETFTEGGAFIVRELEKEGRLKVPVVHGDTLTAAVVHRQALEIVKKIDLKGKPIFLVGATSKIGRAVAIKLALQGIRVRMLTDSKDRFVAIQNEAEAAGSFLEYAGKSEDGKDCPFWITGKALPTAATILKYIPKDGIVLNFSVPDPLMLASRKLLRTRPDVRHFDGGMMAYDPAKTTMWNRIRLLPGLTYACHAGTIVHAYMGWTEHEVGQVEIGRMETVINAAFEVGFSMPQWTNFLRPAVLPTTVKSTATLAAAG